MHLQFFLIPRKEEDMTSLVMRTHNHRYTEIIMIMAGDLKVSYMYSVLTEDTSLHVQ